MDAYTAPNTTTAAYGNASMPARALAALCLTLGVLGALMTCFSAFSVVWGQVAPNFIDPAQAEVMRAIQEEQGWWVIPMNVVMLTAKMVLSVGLIAGSGLVVADKPNGPGLLRPVLAYGVILELGMGLWGAGYTALNFGTMGERFGEAMAANPDMPPGFEQSGGAMFGTMMLVAMVAMLGWAVVKAILYTATWYSLRPVPTD
jgi:uncharacterized membrane protein YjgN (DUF898 family)